MNEQKINPFEIVENSFGYSPRFVHFHEVVNHIIGKKLHEFWVGRSEKEKPHKADIKCDVLNNYLNEAFNMFYRLNYSHTSKIDLENDEKYMTLKNEYLTDYLLDAQGLTENLKTGKRIVSLSRLNLMKDEQKQKLKVGLANIKVYHKNIQESYLKNPIVTTARRDEINGLLNQVTKESYNGEVDILVFPETSIPYKWIKWLGDFVKKHEIALVFGMEHLVVNEIAYNFNVTLLPIIVNALQSDGSKVKMKAVIPIVRLKNHYSPGEIEELKGYRYNIPVPTPQRYDLISWKGLNFAIFNCFELTDTVHRSLFRSKVDFLIACEFNRDTNYFSNIVDAVSRDVHCYFIQSNNSEYGDNRITKPSKTAAKDIIKIKGGENSTILVSTIDIKKLREFQKKEYNLQMKDPSFKMTPPGFNVYENRLGVKK